MNEPRAHEGRKIICTTGILLVIVMTLSTVPSVAGETDPTLDDMTGGMSTDADSLLEEGIFWLVGACLVAAVGIGAIGVVTSDSDLTKRGGHGTLAIIGIVIFYYAGRASIEYFKVRYG